ncbi:MAG: hypothetical protein ILA52_01180 [Alphaproteobacteria bacterium]|nr:hypothetical protein [Alphaproteobacteria bacterium]
MEKKIIARRSYNNCVAFLEVKNGKLTVSGVYYIGFSGNKGPKVELNMDIPENIQKEIEKLVSWQEPKRHILRQFCQKCYEAASRQDDWFTSFVNKP